MRTRLPIILLSLLVVLGVTTAPSWSKPPAKRTAITLLVVGCDGCTVQPVQTNTKYNATYQGPTATVTDGQVVMTVPTRRTKNMSFLVYAPWAQGEWASLPMVPVVRYRAFKIGHLVPDGFGEGVHPASTCWAGTKKRSVTNTMIVRPVENEGQLYAAGYLQRTMSTKHNWKKVGPIGVHPSEATLCV